MKEVLLYRGEKIEEMSREDLIEAVYYLHECEQIRRRDYQQECDFYKSLLKKRQEWSFKSLLCR